MWWVYYSIQTSLLLLLLLLLRLSRAKGMIFQFFLPLSRGEEPDKEFSVGKKSYRAISTCLAELAKL